jgi:hypothetical protein
MRCTRANSFTDQVCALFMCVPTAPGACNRPCLGDCRATGGQRLLIAFDQTVHASKARSTITAIDIMIEQASGSECLGRTWSEPHCRCCMNGSCIVVSPACGCVCKCSVCVYVRVQRVGVCASASASAGTGMGVCEDGKQVWAWVRVCGCGCNGRGRGCTCEVHKMHGVPGL